jgi:hypothetical protein
MGQHEHDDDLEAEVYESAEEEIEAYPDTGDELDEEPDEDEREERNERKEDEDQALDPDDTEL